MKNKRELKIENGFNFRDVGGYENVRGAKVKWHKIIRGAFLSDLSTKDQQVLLDYGVRTIIDLRSDNEVKKYPDRYLSPINYIRVPVLNRDLTNSMTQIGNLTTSTEQKNGLVHMLRVYALLVADSQAQKAYKKVFEILADPGTNGGVLIHCATGKDRTGIVIMLLLKLLGITDQVILDDYLLTNPCSALQINKRLNNAKSDGADNQMLKTIFNLSTVNIQYYNMAISVINECYKGFSSYFQQNLGIGQTTISALRKKYLL